METLIDLFGSAICSSCPDMDEISVLTEIHINSFVYEFGDVNSVNFEQKREEIKSFKVDFCVV